MIFYKKLGASPILQYITEKHGFFETLTCKTTSNFKFTLVERCRFKSGNKNL